MQTLSAETLPEFKCTIIHFVKTWREEITVLLEATVAVKHVNLHSCV